MLCNVDANNIHLTHNFYYKVYDSFNLLLHKYILNFTAFHVPIVTSIDFECLIHSTINIKTQLKYLNDQQTLQCYLNPRYNISTSQTLTLNSR